MKSPLPAIDSALATLELDPESSWNSDGPAMLLAQRPVHIATQTDEALRDRVQLFLDNSPLAAHGRIQVTVDGDRVTLSGAVCSWHEKQLATEFSRRVAGVIHVLNRLMVERDRDAESLELADQLLWNI